MEQWSEWQCFSLHPLLYNQLRNVLNTIILSRPFSSSHFIFYSQFRFLLLIDVYLESIQAGRQILKNHLHRFLKSLISPPHKKLFNSHVTENIHVLRVLWNSNTLRMLIETLYSTLFTWQSDTDWRFIGRVRVIETASIQTTHRVCVLRMFSVMQFHSKLVVKLAPSVGIPCYELSTGASVVSILIYGFA